MCNNQRGTVFHQMFQRLLHCLFALGIECRSGFVENKDRRVLEDSAGNRYALALPTAETRTTVADVRTISIGRGHDEIVCISDTRRCLHCLLPCLSVGRRLSGIHAESDVIIETVVEKDSLLIDGSHQRTQVVGTDIAYIGAIDGDSAGYGVVEARKEVSQGSFTTTGLPYQSHHLPFADREIDMA